MVEVKVDGLPPPLRRAYLQRGRMRFLSSEARKFKLDVFVAVRKLFAVTHPTWDKDCFTLNIAFHSSSWLNKNGSVKKRDCTNLIKVAEDAFSEAIGIDDSRFWKVTAEKISCAKEMTVFRLE